MNLGYTVLDFIQRVRQQPADATDPRLLGRLEAMAKQAFSGAFVALMAPLARDTREVRVLLPNALTTPTNRQSVIFPQPIEILGFNPIVTNAGAGTAPNPSEIDCAIDINNEQNLAASDGVSSPAGGTMAQFISLPNFSILTPRMMGLRVESPKPDVGFQFKNKRPGSGAADAFVCVGIFYRYCKPYSAP